MQQYSTGVLRLPRKRLFKQHCDVMILTLYCIDNNESQTSFTTSYQSGKLCVAIPTVMTGMLERVWLLGKVCCQLPYHRQLEFLS